MLSTFREAVSAPRALGARLSGTGRLTWALSYAALCAWLGALPLSLLVSGLLLTVADPLTLGIRSTGVLSLAVTVVLSSIGFASLVPLVVVLWSLTVLATARVLSLPARFELLARASAYGLSLLAVPVLGPLLLPLAWLWLSVSVQAVLASAGDGRRAALAVLWALALWTAPFALLWLR